MGVSLSEYAISTDSSYMPYKDRQQITGTKINGQPQQSYMYRHKSTDSYVKLVIAKSPTSYVYDREVQKFTTLFSYIGGFLSACTTALFFFKFFVEESYEIELVTKFFSFDAETDHGEIFRSFNILRYIPLKFYELLKEVGFPKDWDYADSILRYRREMVRQMDVSLLLKRLANLERIAISLGKVMGREIEGNMSVSFETVKMIKIAFIKNEENESENSNLEKVKERKAQRISITCQESEAKDKANLKG